MATPGKKKTTSGRKMPRVVIHAAVSTDGRFDWFTPDIATFYKLAQGWKEDATLVGSGTILASPEKMAPDRMDVLPPKPPKAGDKRPLLVIADSRGRVRCYDALRKTGYWRDAVAFCSLSTPKKHLSYLKSRRVEPIIAGKKQVDLGKALAMLRASHGTNVVRVDSGGTLNGSLLRAGLVNEVSVLVHPVAVGGLSPKSFFFAPDLASPKGIIPLKLVDVQCDVRGVVWLRYRVA
jgi:2,5-diamino-6-(ribosylamino)-4(3H)-pyrimidinone 5'-phosphate reductase